MTSQEYGNLLLKGQLREKLISKLNRDYPRYHHRVDDWAARAILYGLRKSGQFKDDKGATAYVFEKAVFLVDKELQREIERRKSLNGVAKVSGRRYDPTRQIDYKVDLEKAIRLTTGHKIVQQALWHIHFEDWTWDEVIAEMPKDVLPVTWRLRIHRANIDLQRRLNAYGYRG